MKIRLGRLLILVGWRRSRTNTQSVPADKPATRTQRVAGAPSGVGPPLVRAGPGGAYRRDLYDLGQVLDRVV